MSGAGTFQLLSAVRQSAHTRKLLKDIRRDRQGFRDSPSRRVSACPVHFHGAMIFYNGGLFC